MPVGTEPNPGGMGRLGQRVTCISHCYQHQFIFYDTKVKFHGRLLLYNMNVLHMKTDDHDFFDRPTAIEMESTEIQVVRTATPNNGQR